MSIEEINNPYLKNSMYKYKVNQYGDIIDLGTNNKLDLIEKEDGLYVELDWVDGKKLYNAAMVVIVAFRPHMGLPIYNYKDIIPLYKNGNSKDITPNNLTYKLPITGIVCEHYKYIGFYHIPEYSNYAINKEGKVLNVYKDFICKQIPNIHVVKATLISDQNQTHKPTIARLLALTFIDHGANYDKLKVNHIDGNKKNDRIENLEWVTASDIVVKTYENGSSSIKKVKCRNYLNDEVNSYRSMQHCYTSFKVSENYLIKSRDIGFMKLSDDPKDWYYISYDDTDWKDLTKNEIDSISVKQNNEEIQVKALNVFTNNLFIFRSLSDASNKTNVARKSIMIQIEKESKVPSKGYIFRLFTNERPFPKFTKDQLYVLQYNNELNKELNNLGLKRGYSVIDLETNEKKVWTEAKDLADFLKISSDYLYRVLKDKRGICTFNGKYQVSIIPLEGTVE